MRPTPFCVLVWFPLWRPLVLSAMIGLHVGIGATLGLWTFSLIMTTGCLSFLPNEPVRRAVDGLARLFGRDTRRAGL